MLPPNLCKSSRAPPASSICIILKYGRVSFGRKIAAFEFVHLFCSTLLSPNEIFETDRFFLVFGFRSKLFSQIHSVGAEIDSIIFITLLNQLISHTEKTAKFGLDFQL
jgi:hypothetical protein